MDVQEDELGILKEIEEASKHGTLIEQNDWLDATSIKVIKNKKEYLIFQNYLEHNSNYYELPSHVFYDSLRLIANNIEHIDFDERIVLSLSLEDIDLGDELDDKYFELFSESVKSLKETTLEYDRVPYPNVVVDANGFKLTFISNQIISLSLNDNIIGSFMLKSSNLYNKVKEDYKEFYNRTGLFSYKTMKFSWDGSNYYEMDNSTYRLDTVNRLFNFQDKVNNMTEDVATVEKITFIYDDKIELVIFENNYWYYEGEYYYTDEIYQKVSWMLSAG